ncbi:MAG: oligosaccharide flippase family protein [bacterium]|nr:oligosaccharide flippase family protein [bacterium]
MILPFKRLFKDSIIYGISGVFEQFVGFLLLPVFTRIFSPSDYGIIDIITTGASITLIVLGMGLNSATQRYYFDTKTVEEKKTIVSTSFWFLGTISIITCTFLYFLAKDISHVLFGHYEHVSIIKIAIIAIPITMLISYSKDALRLKFVPWKYNIVNIFFTLSRVGIIVYLVVILRKGIIGNFQGILLASLLTLILVIYYSRDLIKPKFSLHWLKPMLRYGIPLLFAGLAYWIVSLSDRIILLKLSTLEEVGLYSVGNKISSIMFLVISAFSLAWAPFIFSHYKEKGSSRLIVKTLTYYTIILLCISLLLSTFSFEILSIITTKEYLNATKVIGLLTLSLSFLGISGILATGLTLSKKTKFITLATFTAAGINIAFNFILIPKFNMVGAALATLISYFILSFLYYIFSQKCFPLQFELKKLLKIFILYGIFITLSSLIILDNLLYGILLKICIVSIFILLLFVFKIFDKNEIAYLKTSINQIKNIVISRLKSN